MRGRSHCSAETITVRFRHSAVAPYRRLFYRASNDVIVPVAKNCVCAERGCTFGQMRLNDVCAEKPVVFPRY